MKKINKLFAVWQPFEMKRSIYLTTFANDVKRSLQRDSEGFFFMMNKEKERITEAADIERITNFLNIK